MPQKLTLKEIARKNPHIDLQKLDEWERMRTALKERGLSVRRPRKEFVEQETRAKIVDDIESDPRLVRLQR
jgi:hypothetical protein